MPTPQARSRWNGGTTSNPRSAAIVDGVLARLLEVAAVLDQLGAEAAHRGVLLGAVAVRHEDRDGHAEGAAPA